MTTVIIPVAPVPTTALIAESDTTVKEEAALPPKRIAVAPVKCAPTMVTTAPVPAWVGEKEVMCGATGGGGGVVNVNPARESVPLGPDTNTDPLAPVPTTAVMAVSERMEKDCAATSPNLTEVIPVREVPRICTVAPVPALVGAKTLMVG